MRAGDFGIPHRFFTLTHQRSPILTRTLHVHAIIEGKYGSTSFEYRRCVSILRFSTFTKTLGNIYVPNVDCIYKFARLVDIAHQVVFALN